MITGAASGIGLETAVQLAGKGHAVIIADRNVSGAEAVAQRIVAAGGQAEARALDLGSLARIRAFAQDELARNLPIDVLVNNAGLLPPATRATTSDGFELVFGVAYLGHFALTGLLLPALRRSTAPRVISVSSLSHANAHLDFDNLQFEHGYSWSKAYAASKLACIYFARELDRRAREADTNLLSVAVHPGISKTPIGANQQEGAGKSLPDRLAGWAYILSTRFLGQTAEQGAMPSVFAATAPDVTGGGYYGPTGFIQANGPVGAGKPGKQVFDQDIARSLWARSEQLSGVVFEGL